MKNLSVQDMVIIGVMAAILGVVSQVVIPIGAIPFSMAPLIVYLIGALLGYKKGSICFLVYVLLGIVGIPVFSMVRSGPAALLGPTGGYIIGYLFVILVVGYAFEHYPRNYPIHIVSMVIGLIFLYTCGSIWYSFIATVALKKAIASTALPFVIPDLVKIVAAEIIILPIRQTVNKALKMIV